MRVMHVNDEDENGNVRYRAPALDKGLDILEVLASQAQGLTRLEIGRELGVNPSQIYRMLERLVARGFVVRVDGGDRYILSMRMFLLATKHPPFRRLIAQVQPMLDDFSNAVSQSCHLVVPECASALIIAQASPVTYWEFRARLGAQMDLFTTGSGITLLAFQRQNFIHETLAQWGCSEYEEKLKLVEPELASTLDKGYRVAPSRQVSGVTDVSVPILGPDGNAIAALTCVHIQQPDDSEERNHVEIVNRLLDMSSSLSMANG